MPKRAELAKVIRSKNAGPFGIAFDIIFANRADDDAVRASGVITPELIGKIYGVATQQILTSVWFDVANAIKFTLPQPRPQGIIGETDMHAAQQHAPLMEIVVP
jgi:hypothetical protein